MVSVYKLPTFNLVVNIWNGLYIPGVPVGPPNTITHGQLRIARTAFALTAWLPNFDFPVGVAMWLNLPPHTEVQGLYGLGNKGGATVEVPGGSGRYYAVVAVDDVAKGFNNEYRVAMIVGYTSDFPIP